jgi:hypothetical protein
MGFDQDGAGEPQQGLGVREDADDVGAAFDFLVQPFERVGAPDLLPVPGGEAGEGQQVLGGVVEHGLDLGQLPAEHAGDDVELLADVLLIGLGEDGADCGGDHLGVAPGDLGQDVAQEVHAAALPGRAEQHGGDRGLQSGVGVGDDQLNSGEPARLQRSEEGGPERAVLGVADGEPEHLPPSVRADSGGDDDSLGDDPTVDPGLA